MNDLMFFWLIDHDRFVLFPTVVLKFLDDATLIEFRFLNLIAGIAA